VTSRAELEHVAFELFAAQGFEATTVDEIARAAGIGRRTFFRYFPSKNDIPWGAFDEQLDQLRADLRAYPAERPLMDVVRAALVEFNRVPSSELPWHRRRMALILRVPALQAHSTLRYANWRQVIAEFVAQRLDQPVDALEPQTIAYATLGVALASYEQWLRDESQDLAVLMESAMTGLSERFTGVRAG
jgi:mycofactocin system transcriptional regulator